MGFNIRKTSKGFNLWKYPKLASSVTNYSEIIGERKEKELKQKEKLRILREKKMNKCIICDKEVKRKGSNLCSNCGSRRVSEVLKDEEAIKKIERWFRQTYKNTSTDRKYK